jgi:adenine/guanine phosphoribosyltransferase-like PRPP-binding protein
MVKADTIDSSHDLNNSPSMNKHPLISGHEMEYPVGAHILNNMSIINDMADSIYLVMTEHYDLTHTDNVIIFCRGSSGAIISGIVSVRLSQLLPERTFITIHHIKKEGEQSHAAQFVESSLFYRSITIIVDDFISTGRTIRSILERIHGFRGSDQIIDILAVSGSISDEYDDEIRHGICSR